MRAQCCICSDLFEDEASISALQCGHTFHEHCIKQWLNTANTCPSCRVGVDRGKIIKKLFFDKGDEAGVDQSKLTNENHHLKTQLREKDAEKEVLEDQKNTLENKIKGLQQSKKDQEAKIKEEQSAVSSLKKQLQYFQAQQKSLEIERDECKKAKRQMIELKNIQTVLTGCESDVQELLGNRCHGEGSVTEFAKYCAILKNEYEQLKSSRKALKSDFDKFKREFISKDTLLKDTTKENSYLKEVVKKSEEDLQKTEKIKDHLQKKVVRLQNALKSPSAKSNCSFVETLTEPSPMISTPVLTSQSQNDNVLDTPVRPAVMDTLRVAKPNTKFLKITSASSQPPAKKQRCDDVNTLGSFNIFKKKSGLGDMQSAIRKGYDGLGGHTTFTERQSKPKLIMKKSVSRTTNGKMVKIPKLPSLDNFITID